MRRRLALRDEEQGLSGGPAIGTALTYAVGDKVFASANGLLTNNILDAYERNVVGATNADVTLIGIVKVIPDANSALLELDLRV